jgi:hypothetical protein
MHEYTNPCFPLFVSSFALSLCLVQRERRGYIGRALHKIKRSPMTVSIPRSAVLFVPLTFSLLFFACSGSKGLDRSRPLDASTVMAAVEARNAGVRVLENEGTISVDTPELSNSGSILLRILKPDSMLINITGPFGVNVARGLVTSKDFTFYNSLENTVATGTTSAKNLKNIIRIPIEFRDILEIASGTMGFDRRPKGVIPAAVQADNLYLLTYKGDDETTSYEIDLDHSAVRRYLRKRNSGEVLEDVSFKDFRKKSDLYLPTVINIERPAFNESVALTYDRMTLNSPPLDFSIRIPKSATKIKF